MLIDSHCHLDFPDFSGELDDVVTRAHDNGVGLMLTICTHVTKFDQVLAVAEAYDNIYCSVGIHPHNAGSEPEIEAAHLVKMAEHPKVVGIGETGLDYFYSHSAHDSQRACFRTHIKAARETGLPLIVHSRDAEDDTIRILQEEAEEGAFPGLLHCFSSDQRLAEAALDLGLYISFSGILTFKKADSIRQAAAQTPLDRLLVETDAPYLAPVPNRGKRNEPSFVVHTAQHLAQVCQVSEQQMIDQTTDNFFNLFRKVPAEARHWQS